MLFKSWKERMADYIKTVTEPQICELKQELGECRRREQDYLHKCIALEEYVSTMNTLMGEMRVLQEKVRNNNDVLEQLRNRTDGLENTESNQQVMVQDFQKRIQTIEENLRNNNVVLNSLQNEVKTEIIESKIEAIKNEVKRLKEKIIIAPDGEVIALNERKSLDTESTYSNIDYFSFENYFRGSEEVIRQRQKIYLPYFEGNGRVLDLGCGRGEFLELLKENGIAATGVDFYEEFAIYGRNKGLDVVTGDAISYLAQFSEKVDGIFAGQLVEHLSVEQIVALCENAYDKLEEGKYLIMETPNPTSLAIYTHAFYIDPSHQRPVHPLTLKYFVEKAGFRDVQIMFIEASKLEESIPILQGTGINNLDEFNESMQRVANYLYGSQDYAIIARK